MFVLSINSSIVYRVLYNLDVGFFIRGFDVRYIEECVFEGLGL